jgi:flagellar protein FlgJ
MAEINGYSSVMSGVSSILMDKDTRIWNAAQKLEASFLAEMLKAAGLGEMKSSFAGGEGEAQFASFMREAQAQNMVEAGGIGLAQAFFESIKEMEYDKNDR